MFSPTSLTLLEKIQSDDRNAHWQAAWKDFYPLYQTPLAYTIKVVYRSKTGGLNPSSALVDDILAAVFVSLCRGGVYRYKKELGKLRTYLRVIAVRKVIDHLRKEKPFDRPLSLEELKGDLPEESEDEQQGYSRLILGELLKTLQRNVPPRQFTILEKRCFHGETVAQIANELGMKPEQVSRELYKATSKLTELVKNNPQLKEEYRP